MGGRKGKLSFPRQLPKAPREPGQIRGLSAEPTSLQAPQWASRDPSALPLTVCMTSEGRPWVSSVVRKTRMQIAQDPSLNYEYTPVMGMKSFIQASLNLLFGKNSQVIVENRVRSRALPSLTETRGVETGGLGLYECKSEEFRGAPRGADSPKISHWRMGPGSRPRARGLYTSLHCWGGSSFQKGMI